MKKSIYIVFAVFLLVGLGVRINITDAADLVELKAITAFPKTHPLVSPQGYEWIKMINEGLKGKVHIKYVGGPEVVPAQEQIEAIRNNMIQISMLPVAYYRSLVPAAATMVVMRFKNAMELRKSAFHDFLVEEHEKIGVRYLGPETWGGTQGTFHMWSKRPIKKLADLNGMKMRSFFQYDRFQKALGITPVTIAVPELFTALERGVVDGFCFPLCGPRQMGWTKSTQYIISYPFYAMDLPIVMNLATWQKLPEPVQKKIEEITAKKYEPYMMNYIEGNIQREWDELAKAGVKKVFFSDEEAKRFIDTAYRVKWEEYEENLPADLVKKLKKLTGN
jgi:TRAP-type C4-dicarboxylate transport system substrate-binding protein